MLPYRCGGAGGDCKIVGLCVDAKWDGYMCTSPTTCKRETRSAWGAWGKSWAQHCDDPDNGYFSLSYNHAYMQLLHRPIICMLHTCDNPA